MFRVVATVVWAACVAAQGSCPRGLSVRTYGLGGRGAACTSHSQCINSDAPLGLGIGRLVCSQGVCSDMLQDAAACTSHSQCVSGLCAADSVAALLRSERRCAKQNGYADGSFCADDRYCDVPSFCSGGVCGPRPGIGAVCFDSKLNATYKCLSGAVCPVVTTPGRQSFSVLCQAASGGAGLGRACGTTQDCGHEYFCDTLRTSPTCQTLRGIGESCAADSTCRVGAACDGGKCKGLYSLSGGVTTSSSRFCNLGLFRLSSGICGAPKSLGVACTSDAVCLGDENGGLLSCSCVNEAQGTCTYIVEQSCYASTRSYLTYDAQKQPGDDYAAIVKRHLCCLKDSLDDKSAAWWLGDLGRHGVDDLDCDDDAIPVWVVIIIILCVLLCCTALVLGGIIVKRRYDANAKNFRDDDTLDSLSSVGERNRAGDVDMRTDVSDSAQLSKPAESVGGGGGGRVPADRREVSPAGIEPKRVDPQTEHHLHASLVDLQGLREHPLAPPDSKGHRHPVELHKNFCVNFSSCTLAGVKAHTDIFMHECSGGQHCTLIDDADHCADLWHILPQCPQDTRCADETRGHQLAFRHTCPDGLRCRHALEPVHQQLFSHGADARMRGSPTVSVNSAEHNPIDRAFPVVSR